MSAAAQARRKQNAARRVHQQLSYDEARSINARRRRLVGCDRTREIRHRCAFGSLPYNVRCISA